jgi:NAD(P)-dependent dehydrogenase (short-subunit alcohol dehydrogenase family)
MARVFVTGSADGLGKMAAELLIEQGHNVVLHRARRRDSQ